MYKELSTAIEKICKETKIPYLEIVCHQENQLRFRYHFGKDSNGYLQMYSCSKPITVCAAMILIEQGKMSLDDAVSKYLPEIKECFLLDGAGKQIKPKNTMKIRHLLTMTAGFHYDVTIKPIRELQEKEKNAGLRDFVKAFVKSSLWFEPGERFEYSLCHDVLAAVIETVAGVRFSEFVKQVIFQPLGMQKSFFDNREVPLVEMYEVNRFGEICRITNDNPMIFTKNYESGGAGLVSTLDDYAKFACMLANGGITPSGERIIGSKYLERMREEQIGQMSIKNEFTCVQGTDYGYGLGVRVRKIATAWGLPKGEFGWDGAAGSYLMVDPVNKISVVITMNVKGWPKIFQDKHLEIVRLIYENNKVLCANFA